MWEARGSCIYCVKLQQRTAHRVSYAVNVLLLFALLNLAHCVLWGSSLASRLASPRLFSSSWSCIFSYWPWEQEDPWWISKQRGRGVWTWHSFCFYDMSNTWEEEEEYEGGNIFLTRLLSLSLSIRSYVHRQNNPKGRDEETLHINLYAADLSVHFGDKQKHIDLHFELEILFFSNFHTYFTICQFHW